MDPKEYDLMFKVECNHWWYLGMRAITTTLIDRYYPGRSNLRILDAGCGTGAAMTTYLSSYGAVTGIDISRLALDYCRQRNAKCLGRASVSELPFASSSFDLLTSFDVLYEDSVKDDLSVVREFSRVLASGGRVLLRLPAYDWLRGQHDRIISTARRYLKPQVRSMLQAGGFEVEHISYANTLLFPLALFKRTTERLLGKDKPVSDLSFPTDIINGFLTMILSLEAPLIAKHDLPYGLSVIAVGKKV